MSADEPKVLLRQCPITCGVPTSMTRAAWNRACAAMRRGKVRIAGGYQLRGSVRPGKTWCDVCGGRVLPPELTLLTDREAEDMAKVVNKIGVCEACGQKAALQNNRGQKLCSTCVSIRSQVANRPEAVARAARDLDKAEEMVGLIVGEEALRVMVDDAESKVLTEVRGIVGYEGESPEGLVEAVRSVAVRAAGSDCQVCAEDIEDLLRGCGLNGAEIAWWGANRERPLAVLAALQSLAGLEERVRSRQEDSASGGLNQHWVDLMRACGLEDDGGRKDWAWAAAAAIQEIAERERGRVLWATEAARLQRELRVAVGDVARLSNQTNSEPEHVTRLRDELTRTGAEVEQLRGDLGRSTTVIEELRAEVVELRDKLQAAQSDLLWHRVAADTVKEKLGMGKDDDFGQATENIASMMQAFGRFQALARSEASRADFAEQELRQVREQLRADQERVKELSDRLSTPDVASDEYERGFRPGEVVQGEYDDQAMLADFARLVLAGKVAISFHGVQ